MAGRINTWEELRAPGKLFPTDLPGFLGGNAVDCIEFIGSQLMYHEMMHLVRFKRKKILSNHNLIWNIPCSPSTGEDEAYGIKPCVELTPMVASRNAESHAIFGGLVRTMEYKQKLVTDYPDTGHLTEDNAIPDRVSAPPPAKARRTTPLTCENRDGHIEGKRLVCTQFEA
jgi:hypothetical protein